MLPNFIIIGAMKAGTTSLYHYIASHPDIQPSLIKETNFFKSANDFSKGLPWYKSLFKNGNKFYFEASPDYTKRHVFPGVPERIYSILPNIKLIYILRDPIERIISHYIHNYAHGRELKSFSEVVKETSSHYVQTSKYYFQLQLYLRLYKENQLHIIEFEELRKDPFNVLRDVFLFLGIQDEYNFKESILEKKFHESSSKKWPSLIERELTKKIDNPYLLSIVKKIGQYFRKPVERPILSPEEREMLVAQIAPDIEKLRHFSGMRFSNWSL